jgi:ribokinase
MASIAVVGSTNIDMVTYSDQIPERGETVTGKDFAIGFGGKGANQAVIAALLGAKTYLVGAVGNDVFGESAIKNFTDRGVSIDYLATVAGSSGVAPIWVDGDGDNRIIVVPGANAKVTIEQVENAINSISDLKVVIGQFEIPVEVTTAAFAAARKLGITTILNPAPYREIPADLLALTDWLIPNNHEFQDLHPQHLDPTVEGVIAEYATTQKINLVVTLGEDGVVIADGTITKVAAQKVKPVDTTGAGDCFVGTFAFGLANGMSPIAAATLGCQTAGLSVTRLGAQSSYPSAAEAKQILANL